jgi:hypothetical protein
MSRNIRINIVRAAALSALATLLISGCGRDAQSAAPSGAAVLPAALFVTTEPEGIQSVLEAKRDAREGDRVAVRGRIGGVREPFVSGRAVMTIMDMSLPTCADKPEDCCETPWDYCCETRADIVAHAATVQVSGENGAPLRADLKGAGGLAPLTEVVVVGRVGKTPSPTAFLVHAEAIYVRK